MRRLSYHPINGGGTQAATGKELAPCKSIRKIEFIKSPAKSNPNPEAILQPNSESNGDQDDENEAQTLPCRRRRHVEPRVWRVDDWRRSGEHSFLIFVFEEVGTPGRYRPPKIILVRGVAPINADRLNRKSASGRCEAFRGRNVGAPVSQIPNHWSAYSKRPIQTAASTSSPTNFTCAPTNIPGHSLTGASETTKQELACTYESSQCIYDTTGKFESAISANDCPPSVNPDETSSNSSLCKYFAAVCFYLCVVMFDTKPAPQSGNLTSGLSACPQSVEAGNGIAGSVPVGADSALAISGGAASSAIESKMPQPVLIALIAMNGFLILGILVIAAALISDLRGSSTAPRRCKKLDATRGLDHDYMLYDAPLPYQTPSQSIESETFAQLQTLTVD
ncbi:hypothetical protein B0H17DRAFT_1148125 [Mycena rosella]|uniref:Uncharacterized protein n=1 Tax=Mycena rosella TaxID=1033263 RepID=A0AAD7CGQ6_MYCRO|nr:hypothetical protein B0H17DRAFT_1148125 [Mycena rosella]